MFGTKTLEEKDSKHNGHIKVIKSWGLGTRIQVGGLTQSGGIVESMWKSTLKRLGKQKIASVLILGLGGGTLVGVIKKYWPDAKITAVEIDPIMVQLGEKYLGLNRKFVKIEIVDAIKYSAKKFDLVIVDLYAGDTYPAKFESGKFLKQLTENKTVIFNRLFNKDKQIELSKFERKLNQNFKKVEKYKPLVNQMFICQNFKL